MRRLFETLIISAVLFALPVAATAQTRVPNVFVPGQAALAEEVNENFQRLAGPDTGTIFIPPKALDSSLAATAQVVLMATAANNSYTAAFGRPADYVPGVADDITIRPLLSGCLGSAVLLEIATDFLDIGPNGDNSDADVITEFTMPADATTITAPGITRGGLGAINYVRVNRMNAVNDTTCNASFLNLHGVIIEYPR